MYLGMVGSDDIGYQTLVIVCCQRWDLVALGRGLGKGQVDMECLDYVWSKLREMWVYSGGEE